MDNIEYYNERSSQYVERTRNLDLSQYYEQFIKYIPKHGHILDVACGSGRDSKIFMHLGYKVTAFEASSELAKLASQYIEQPVIIMTFDEMSWINEFDGIWSSACLLHVPLDSIHQVFEKHIRALRNQGVWYMSFKEGDGERIDKSGRTFTCYTVDKLTEILNVYSDIKPINIWGSSQPETNELWVKVMLK